MVNATRPVRDADGAGRRPWLRPGAVARRPWLRHGAVVVGILALWGAGRAILGDRHTLALATAQLTPLHTRIGDFRDWVNTQRSTNPVFTGFLDVIRSGVESLTGLIQALISQPALGRPVPIIGWLGVVALATLAGYAFGNRRVAALAGLGTVSLGLLGLWQESMQTLALTVAAVLLSVLIGIPLGIWVGLSRRLERLATPVLDVMQAMPTFVYLAPLTLFFLIGPASAVIATLIYAMPPVIRLTAHGVRNVERSNLEVSRSLGATRWQELRTVQIPLALRTIVLGINQTTMAALSMVTVAALIGAPGLGSVVIKALLIRDVGGAFVGGLAIVVMAVVLDRITTAASRRARHHRTPRQRTVDRAAVAGLGAVTLAAVYLSHSFYWAAVFPGPARGGYLGGAVERAVNDATAWSQAHLFGLADGMKDVVTYGLINPLESWLAQSPWYLTCAVILLLAWRFAGHRVLPVTAVCLALLLGTGLWQAAMVTLTATLVATVMVVALGVLIGLWIGRGDRADSLLRPVLDAAQVMPPFVYLVPVLGLFGPTRFTAIVAAVIFAVPVATKIVADGIRGVPAGVVEAAVASGSTSWQIITKVQLPLARRSLALAANQGLIYVLSMVVIGGLVGAGALGYLVVAGFSQTSMFGKGLAAGAAIVLLGVLLDRITQAAARRAEARPARVPG